MKSTPRNSKRKGLSQKTRFEIFKRDSFRCQYCGKSAPDVVLHVDHISPVSIGGGNEILNLVTSCVDCNLGKGARRLSDSSVLAKQRAQLEMLQIRREQLEMMLRWKEAQIDNSDAENDAACKIFSKCCPGISLNENGKQDIGKLVRKFGLARTIEAIRSATSECLRYDSDGKATLESARIALRAIFIRCEPEDIQKLYRLRTSVTGRWPNINRGWAMAELRKAYDACHDLEMVGRHCRDAVAASDHFSEWVDSMRDFTANQNEVA